MLGVCYAIVLDGERARHEIAVAAGLAEQLGLRSERAKLKLDAAWIERLLTGHAAEADLLADVDGPPLINRVAGTRRMLALARVGRLDEAAALLEARDADGPAPKLYGIEDAMVLLVEARLAAVHGEPETARRLVAEAIASGSKDHQFVNAYGDLLRDAGDALGLAGDVDGAHELYEQALAVAERKGHLAAVADTHARLAAIAPPS